MTIHQFIFTPFGQISMMVFLSLLTLQMAVVFAFYEDKRKAWMSLNIIFLLVSFSVTYFFALDFFCTQRYPDRLDHVPAILIRFRELPVSLFIVYGVISFIILIYALYSLFSWRKRHPNSRSIKETMDNLPVGVAYGKTDGTVVFSNLMMNELSRSLTGKGITDLHTFRNTVCKDNAMQTEMPDGSGVWQLSFQDMEVHNEQYIQLTAMDVTKQAMIVKELEEKNKKLREMHMRLDIYNKQAERIIIAQELLNTRMTVHTEVGNVLLESRHFLKDPSSIDEEKLLQALKNTNKYLLKEYEEDDTERDELIDALDMADAIGVDVEITGVIPTGEPYRMILAAAIKECSSNTVKHANGDCLYVDIHSADSEVVITIHNNGEQPTDSIKETGGLLSLRSLAEHEKGKMTIELNPEYHLSICIPKQDVFREMPH